MLASLSERRNQRGRHYVVLSLVEAEAVRGLLHMAQVKHFKMISNIGLVRRIYRLKSNVFHTSDHTEITYIFSPIEPYA